VKLITNTGTDRVVDTVRPAMARGGSLDFGTRNWRRPATRRASSATARSKNDVAKTNLAAILEQHGLTNVRSL
jgi:hypothetical protein